MKREEPGTVMVRWRMGLKQVATASVLGRIVNEAVLMFPQRGQTSGTENTASLSPSLTPEAFKGFDCIVHKLLLSDLVYITSH